MSLFIFVNIAADRPRRFPERADGQNPVIGVERGRVDKDLAVRVGYQVEREHRRRVVHPLQTHILSVLRLSAMPLDSRCAALDALTPLVRLLLYLGAL